MMNKQVANQEQPIGSKFDAKQPFPSQLGASVDGQGTNPGNPKVFSFSNCFLYFDLRSDASEGEMPIIWISRRADHH
jgi:hypothetical protein